MELFSSVNEVLYQYFKMLNLSKKSKELYDKIEKELKEDKIKNGIEKTKLDNEEYTSSETSNEDETNNRIKPFDILKHSISNIINNY